MKKEELIRLDTLCEQYRVEMSFFTHLNEIGLIEVKQVKKSAYLHPDQIVAVEKMIRIHRELDVNMEGIDVIFNLLEKIDGLRNELMALKDRLKRYEE